MWFSQHDAVTVSKYLKEIKSFITLRPGIHDVRAYRQHIRQHCMYFLLMHAALWISSPPLYSCVLSLSSGHSSAGKRETKCDRFPEQDGERWPHFLTTCIVFYGFNPKIMKT